MEQNWPNRKIISVNKIELMLNSNEIDGFLLFFNHLGRNAAHVAVLKENEEIVGYISSRYKQSLRVGDNVCSSFVLMP